VSDPQQLPLVLPHTPNLGREDFIVGSSNNEALTLIEAWPDWPSPALIVSGPSGSGKTHLAHIFAARAKADIVEAVTLGGDSALLSNTTPSIVVEDVQGDHVPEASLFHLFNSVRERGGSLLITSRNRTEEWLVSLEDLRSRLRLATPASLGAPDDALLRQVLVKLFADRQLLVEKPVIDYLVARMERSLSAALRLVEMLDRAALSAGRRITRPMAAEILSAAPELPEEFADRQ
jgi:chromosomal replication initiation ATPase DnaA